MRKQGTVLLAVTTAAVLAAGPAVPVLADDAKTVQIVLEADNAPYTYEDDNGDPAGYEYQVLQAVDDVLDDYTFEYQVLDYDTAQAGLQTGKYDLLSGCKFRTPAREEAFLVTEPYNWFFMNLIVKEDSDVQSLEDMDGKSIAPIVSTDGRTVALQDWIKNHPDINIDFEPLASGGTMADELAQVEDGVYDAGYMSKEQAEAILDEAGYTDLRITDRVDGRDTVFLLNKDNEELQQAVNEALEELTANGTLGQLTLDAFGEDTFEEAAELGLRDDTAETETE